MNKVKIPETQFNVHSLIKKRWSARSFSEEMIQENDLNTLFEAASWSASSMNEQPWKYLWATRGSDAFNNMVDCLMEGNQPWAKNGSHMLISLAKRNFDYKDRVNRHHMHDVGAANTTLLLQAAEMDIYGHMMGGFLMDQTMDIFGIDGDQWEIACFIVLGKLDDASKLEEPFKSREEGARSRKLTSEFTKKLS